MILSDRDIRAALSAGRIKLEPMPEEDQYSSTALDLRLGAEFKVWNKDILDIKGFESAIDPSHPDFSFRELATKLTCDAQTDEDGCYRLPSQEMVLGITHEKIVLPRESKIAARVEGRSSLARLGLGIHITAPTIHAGFQGQITLEIVNHGLVPIKLRPSRLRVCQLIFEQVSSQPDSGVNSEFQGQSSTLGQGDRPLP
jgi:dCTP deaminase